MKYNLNTIVKSTLLIKAPKSISGSLDKFASFFEDLHKFVKDRKDLTTDEKTISFEVLLQENYFHYQIVVSPKILSIVKSILYSRFKDIEITEESIKLPEKVNFMTTEFKLKRHNLFPLKTNFSQNEDPYVVLSAILSKLNHFTEGIILQLIVYPVTDPWLSKFMREKFYFIVGTLNSIKIFLEKPFLEHEYVDYYKELKEKFSSPHFLTNLRIMVFSSNEKNLKENFDLVIRSLDKLENGDINSLQKTKIPEKTVSKYFMKRASSSVKMIFNTKELATVFRFPDSSLEISSVSQVSSKKIEPPKNIPIGNLLQSSVISSFGTVNFRDQNFQFGINRKDRNRHLYIIGKTGMGKSKLIELLVISDIYQNKGFAVIDPHGDLAVNILRFIPKERINDVIYFNPADQNYSIGFNPLECYSPESKHQVVTGFIAIFKKLFAYNWTNRLEHMLRFTVLALIEAGDCTVVDIVKLLTDTDFRQNIISKISDPVVKNFWVHEFISWNEKFDNEAIVPIVNLVGEFISNDYIRNVVGQKKSAIDFYKAMNQGKIIIINLAKGKLGEDNASLLGSMIITKIQEAIMARVDLPEEKRREFYLYVDEFQNFATESFNEILSEARKFNLSVTIAHQYLDQLSEKIRKTVFGNIGSFICFRIGAEDAHFLSKEFEPKVVPDDLISLNFREIYVKLSISGKTSDPFSASTITIPKNKVDLTDDIIRTTQSKYATAKKIIESQFNENPEMANLISEEKKVVKNKTFEEPIIE